MTAERPHFRRLPLVLILAGTLSAACGGRPIPSNLLRERFESVEAREARQRAPDLWAAAARARRAAETEDAAGRRDVAEDESTRARLLLDAAVAESRRLELEEERLALEARERDAELAYTRDAARRDAVMAEVTRREAARVATQQAALTFQDAVVDEGRRYRARTDERAALHRDAAAVLVRRAGLLVAAARALDAPAEAVAPVDNLLERADHEPDGDRKVELADRAVRAALAAIGTARASSAEPTGDEVASLVDDAHDAGFDVEQRDHGMVVRIADVFAGSSTSPSAAASRKLRRLAAIAAAHPHGAIQVIGFAAGPSDAGRMRLASTRGSRASAVLVHENVPEARVSAAGLADAPDPEAAGAVEVVFLAYGPRAPG